MLRMLCLLVLVLGLLPGCYVTYHDYPISKVHSKSDAPAPGKLLFNFKVGKTRAPHAGMVEIFPEVSPFEHTEFTDAVPATGMFVDITDTRNPDPLDIPLMAYAFVSGLTMAVLPVWATDTHVMKFEVYKDGTSLQSLSYGYVEKQRIWILLFPWIGVSASNKRELWTDLSNKFFEDAAPLFGTRK